MPMIDFERLRAITGGDPKLEKRLFDLFLSTIDRCASRLALALKQDTRDDWPAALHELKGAAVNVGADNVADICQQAESLTLKQQEACRDSLDAIRTEAKAIRAYYATHYS